MNERFLNFTHLINNIYRNIKRIKTIEVMEYDLRGPHVSCLYYLYNKNNLTIKELTLLCNEDKAMMSRTLEYLKKNDYIKYEDNSNKAYKNVIYLTEKGMEVGKYISSKVDIILEQASEGLTNEDRECLYKTLEIINSNLSSVNRKEDK